MLANGTEVILDGVTDAARQFGGLLVDHIRDALLQECRLTAWAAASAHQGAGCDRDGGEQCRCVFHDNEFTQV